MMLDAGAETDAVNSVGRTAAQMAAFVGMTKMWRYGENGVLNWPNQYDYTVQKFEVKIQ